MIIINILTQDLLAVEQDLEQARKENADLEKDLERERRSKEQIESKLEIAEKERTNLRREVDSLRYIYFDCKLFIRLQYKIKHVSLFHLNNSKN